MSTARYLIGDVFDVLATLPDHSVDCVVTSPPYWRKRDYTDDPREIGEEPSPGEFLAALLRVTDALWRVVKDDGTIWFNLGDSSAGSGGAGGDWNPNGRRAGQRKFVGTGSGIETPQAKSVCWIPQLFGASLAYGRNLLTGEPCRQWVTRPPVTWCKPSVSPGRCDDRFRMATELIVWAAKRQSYYWDKKAILEPLADSPGNRYVRKVSALDAERRPDGSTSVSIDNRVTADYDPADSEGAPPLDWWVVSTSRYSGTHYATFPPDLLVRPIMASCPPGGVVLDPFAGTGTTLMVATGHGRDAIGIDLDFRNADLARERIGMFLTVETLDQAPDR